MQSHAAVCRNSTALGATWLAVFAAGGCAVAVDDVDPAAERTSEAASPIQGGYDDHGDPGVVGVVTVTSEGALASTCTGTLIAPGLVLTAQHCVAQTPRGIRCAFTHFGDVREPARLLVASNDTLWSDDTVWRPARRVVVPPGSGAMCGRDLALIELAEPVPSEEVAPIAPRLTRPVEAGEPYSAVGYGITGWRAGDVGQRRRRDGLEIRCAGNECGDGDHVADAEWRGQTGTCDGDSGGPALDAAGRVVGVLSRGPPPCDRPIYGSLMAHREWLAGEAARAAESGGYAAPAWVKLTTDDEGVDDRWRSCAHAPHGRGTGAPIAVAAAVALAALARRRSTISP